MKIAALKVLASGISKKIISSEGKAQAVLFFFVLAYLAITYTFLNANTAPPKWDDSYYLANSEILFKAFQGNDQFSSLYYGVRNENGFYLFTLFARLMPARAPLITLISLPAYLVFGTGFWGTTATYFLLIICFSWVYYKLVSKVADRWTAILATIITSTMPMVVGLSRIFLVEYGLMILTVLWVYLQIQSNHFRDRRYSLPLGIVLGLGMLMKVTFPIYIISPILLGLISVVTEEKSKRQLSIIFGHCVIALFIGIVLMSSWYIHNFSIVLSNAYESGFGNTSQNYSLGSVFAFKTLVTYWVFVINHGISFYYFGILVMFLIIQGIKLFLRRKEQAHPTVKKVERTQAYLILSWFLVPFFIFTFGVNKDIRFLLPTLPALGFIIAWLIMNSLNRTILRMTVIPLLLIFPSFLLIYTSFPLSVTYSASLKPFLLFAPNVGYAKRPVSQIWEQTQILKSIEQNVQENNGKIDLPIGFIPSYEFFNPNNFMYFTVHQNLPYRFECFCSPAKDQAEWAAQKERLLQLNYVITKTGDQCPSFACNPNITTLLQQGGLPFVELAKFNLPDGSLGIVYKKK